MASVCAYPGCECAETCFGDDGAGAPPPAPAPLVAGAIGRGLTDAQASYRAQLDDLWRDVVAALPDD
jgi:hypothetical protein